MNELPKITGYELIPFIESIGCNKRNEYNNHSVIWSVFTGSFLVIPSKSDEYLDTLTLEYIISTLGITSQVFINMWNDYKSDDQTQSIKH